MLEHNKNNIGYSRTLRNNSTNAEKLVWHSLRGKQLKGCRFYRQKPIGNYIVDFFCSKAKLVIEIDGGQHYSIVGLEKDVERDQYLGNLGLKVLRFSDREVFENLDGVKMRILENL